MRDRLDQLDAAISNRLDQIRTSVDDGRVRTAQVFVVTVLMALAVTAIAAFLVRRWLMVPLASLTAAVRRIRSGLPAAVTPQGPPELKQVAIAVDEMQRTISSSVTTRSEHARRSSRARSSRCRCDPSSPSDLGDYPDGWTMAAGLRAAEGIVAGDCYDVSLISPTTIAIVVLDIAGHGAQSAVAALKCKELLKAALRSGLEPGASLSWLSEQEHGLGELFLTAFVAVLDTASGRGTYANAGHPHAILATGASLERLGPTGPIVGPFITTWDSGSMVVEPGGKLIIYTDGLVEARDHARAFYGETRLIDLLQSLDCREAQPVVDRILGDLDDFHPGRLADDVTIVVACRAGSDDVTEAAPNLPEHVSEPSVSVGTAAPTAGSPALTPRIDDDEHAQRTRAMTDEEHDMSNTPTVRAHANLRLPHSDRAPRLARAFVAENLQGWQLDGMVETASLVVSEVVTNAVIHARSNAELVLERTPTALRISVIDHGDGLTRRERTGGGDGGRGLLIVEALSSRWGTEPTDGGNCVWAELAIEPA